MKYSDGRGYKIDAGRKFSEIEEISYVDTLTQILNRTCKAVIIRTNKGKTTYFYSDSVQVDPAKFSQHSFGNWNVYLKATNGALPLKFISEADNYTWISVAKELREYNIPDKEFKPAF